MKLKAGIASVLALLPVAGMGAMMESIDILPADFGPAQQPQLAATDKTIWIAFGHGTNLYCARSADGGRSFARPEAVGSLPKLALGMRRDQSIYLSRGEKESYVGVGTQPVLVWAGAQPWVFWQRGAELMLKRGAEGQRIAGEAGNADALVLGPGHGFEGVLVVWESGQDPKTIRAARLKN